MDGLWVLAKGLPTFFAKGAAYFNPFLINVYNSPRRVTISDSMQVYEDEQD